MKILIIGYGVIGKWVHELFPDATPFDVDLNQHTKDQIMSEQYDIAFVCVPTDMLQDGSCDTSIVEQVITEHKNHVNVFCIRSTIAPGTTESIKQTIYSKVVFSPEYSGSTQHSNNYDYDFVIIGGNGESGDMVASVYEQICDGRLKIYQTDALTAELVKYGENAWIAFKVSFCNEFARICETFGADYRKWRELWLADPRINPAHTFVYKEAPYYDSHCLNKDIPAIIRAAEKAGYPPGLLRAMEAYNNFNKGT